jgi:hypothetical protein
MKRILFLLVGLLAITAQAQENESIIFISPNYSYQFPIADMKVLYGNNSLVGLDITKVSEQNIVYGISGHFLFSSNVKDTTMLDHMMDENRNIIDQNGQIADVLLQERGFSLSAKLGYFYPLKGKSSGLLTYGSLGFLQHKTRIDVRNSSVPQLDENDLKMYDQLSNGLSASAFAGYMHISEKNHAHVYAGIELTRGFTQNRRDYNYSTGGAITTPRNDSFVGLKFGWIIPISKRTTTEYYYY